MLTLVAALAASALASCVWCVADILPIRVSAWRTSGRRIGPGGIAVFAAIAVGTALRFSLVPPHHAMYVDEPWYAEAACNLARVGRLVLCEEKWSGAVCTPYEKALGWPILIAPWNRLLGCGSSIAIDANRVLGSATVALVALTARAAGARWWQGAVAAAVLALHPVHIAWSATAETNVCAAATVLAGLCGAVLFVRTGRWCGGALAASALSLATAIRPECLVAGLSAAAFLAAERTAPRRRLPVAAAIVLGSAAAALSARTLWAMNESISGGAFLSPRNLFANLWSIARPQSLPIQAIVLLLGAAGAWVARRRQPVSTHLLLWPSIAGALVSLSYDRFDPRMLLGATAGLVALGGLAFDWRIRRGAFAAPLAAGIFLLLVVRLWSATLLEISSPPETQMLETRIAARVGRTPFESDALFVAEQPTVLAAEGIGGVMATAEALRGEELRRRIDEGRPVYFLRDMFCEPGFRGSASPPSCNQMRERFTLSPVTEETLHGRSFSLDRVLSVPPP